MKRYFFLSLLSCFIICSGASAANLYSRTNGSWSSSTTWSYTAGGASCGCTPIASDNVTVDHYVTLDKHLTNVGSSLNGITGVLTINTGGTLDGLGIYDVDIRSTGTLNLCGTLIARDMTFSNGSVINVCPSGTLTITRDFFNKNNSNTVTINGTMTVGGNFTNGNGGVISGTGFIVATNGVVVNNGSIFGCTANAPCTSYPCNVAGPCPSPLPIELLSFTAQYKAPFVNLDWSTQTEINNDFFTLERSANGWNYLSIGTVRGAGNSTMTLFYHSVDERPLSGVSYYRLKQTDFDGQFSYSLPVAVRITDKKSFSVYPTIVDLEHHRLFVRSPENNFSVSLHTDTGKEVLLHPFNSDNLVTIDLPILAKGVYFLTCRSAFQIESFKILVSEQ